MSGQNLPKTDKEYKPTFWGWVISVTVAAGLGSVIFESIEKSVLEVFKSPGKLKYLEKNCWHKSLNNSDNNPNINAVIPLCDLVFQNIGDKDALVASITLNNSKQDRFLSNYPNGISLPNGESGLGSFALVPPGKYLIITLRVESEDWSNGTICLLSGTSESACSS